MAQAADQHIKDLDDLLRYLEDVGYSKGVAAYMMDRRYLDGRLQLEKQECVRDGEPYGNAVPIDPEFGYIELDRHGRVRVVPRIKLWREVRYRIREGCDVRAIWPPRPPASQPAPAPGAPLPPSHKPTAPAKKPKKTQRTRLISLMEEIGLKKSGLLPYEVREKVRPRLKTKYPDRPLPADRTIDRAYEQYANATDTSTE